MAKRPRSKPAPNVARPVGPAPRRGFHALSGAVRIAAVTCLAYSPAVRGGFILGDDNALTNNTLVKAADGIYRCWHIIASHDAWPVTTSSFWIEWRLWGMNPAGYHVTNLVLHIVAALLLWAVL